MEKVIGVKFKTSNRIYYFDPLNLNIAEGDGVIVETARGTEFGDVVQGIKEVSDAEVVAPLKPVLRIASAEDKRMRAENSAKESEAFMLCQEKILEHNLDMKLVDVEYTFNGSKVVFYFTADERVDFRELVKDLAFLFKARIELRQIGVRDEAKMLGGLGSCGRPVCCKTFLDDFRPVSIKMAKEQNLSLSPTKISGLCGRLMCCLQYEQESYETMRKQMPKVGKSVITVDGVGTVISNDVITEKTKVRLTLPDGTIDIKDYHFTYLAAEGQPLPEIAKPLPSDELDDEPKAEAARPRRQQQRSRPQPQKEQPAKGQPAKEHQKPRQQQKSRPQQNVAKPQQSKPAEPPKDGAAKQGGGNNRRQNYRRRKPGGSGSPKAE